MASGMTPAQVSATLDQQQANAQANEGDWLLQLFGGGTAAASPEKPLTAQTCEHIEECQASSRASITLPRPP
jgi:hypothetical protein